MADESIHGVPVPEWIQQMRPGDPVEVTIKGTFEDVFTDVGNGPKHLVVLVRYNSRLPSPCLVVSLPLEPGVNLKTFVAQAVGD